MDIQFSTTSLEPPWHKSLGRLLLLLQLILLALTVNTTVLVYEVSDHAATIVPTRVGATPKQAVDEGGFKGHDRSCLLTTWLTIKTRQLATCSTFGCPWLRMWDAVLTCGHCAGLRARSATYRSHRAHGNFIMYIYGTRTRRTAHRASSRHRRS